jgi:hypothetical protein
MEMTEYAKFKQLDGPAIAYAQVHWVLDQVLWEKLG